LSFAARRWAADPSLFDLVEKLMTKRDVHRAVARVTGESLHTIHQFGFSLVLADDAPGDADYVEASPQIVDWDQLEADRRMLALRA
jgi:hypothetical protein